MSKQAAGEPASAALRYFGNQAALFRTRAGLTQAELGERIGYSESTVASVEQGRRVPQQDFINRVDEILGADAPFLAQARYPARFQDFAALEADAVSLYSYESQLIPGLLQTEGYARVLIGGHCPPLNDATIDERVTARLDRQALLTRKPAMVLSFVVEEVVLRRPLGGPKVLKDQLERLLEVAQLRNVSVQVMPTERWQHNGLIGPILLLETPERRTLAYTEAQGISTVITERDEVSVFAQRYGIIRTQALGTEESACLIERLAGEL